MSTVAKDITLEGACNDGIELDKRFYVPGCVIKFTCANCEERCARDLGRSYLSYPITGKPKRVSMYCGKCDTERDDAYVVVRISVEMATAGAGEAPTGPEATPDAQEATE